MQVLKKSEALTDNHSTSIPAGHSAVASFIIKLVKIVITVSITCVRAQVAGRECITAHLSAPAHSRLSGPYCATPPACIPRLVHQRKQLCFSRITSSFLPAWFCLPVPANGHDMPCLASHCRLKSRYTTSLRPFKLVASWFICCMQQS